MAHDPAATGKLFFLGAEFVVRFDPARRSVTVLCRRLSWRRLPADQVGGAGAELELCGDLHRALPSAILTAQARHC